MDKTLSDAILVANQAGLTDRELAAAVEAATAARLAEAERPGLVPLTHPDLPGRPQLVDPEAVEVYERSGWTSVPEEADEPELDEDGLPKGNASREEWAEYALGHGLTAEDVEPLSRDEIRDHFNEEETS
jgi:hypothetical protein